MPLLRGDDKEAAALIMGAVDEFAASSPAFSNDSCNKELEKYGARRHRRRLPGKRSGRTGHCPRNGAAEG